MATFHLYFRPCLRAWNSSVPWSFLAPRVLGRAPFFSGSLMSIQTSSASASRVRHRSHRFLFNSSHQLPDTTRSPRPGEVDGKQYHFVTQQKFRDLLQEGAFIEHAEFSGNFYGTSFATVREVQQRGRRCILDIESQVCSNMYVLTRRPVERVN